MTFVARHAYPVDCLAVYRVNVELGRMFGREVAETPGGHVAAGTHPAEFARALHYALNAGRADDLLSRADRDQER